MFPPVRTAIADASDEELADLIGQMHGVVCSAKEVMLAAIAEFDRREAYRADGVPTMGQWLVMRLGVNHRTGFELVGVSKQLESTPAIAELFQQGSLSWDQVRAAVSLVMDAGLEDEAVAADAVGKSAAELERLAREARRVSRRESEDRKRNEWARLRWDENGMLRGYLRLADTYGAAVKAEIERRAEQMPREVDGSIVPFEARCARAVYEMACASMTASEVDAESTTTIIHVDAHALAEAEGGLASLELGPIVSMATAHRLACDGRCQVVVDDLLGRTVEIAKTKRAVPRWLRRRVLRRDGGCRWPGCGRTALLHAHHIKWWTRDRGPTEEQNLVALCWVHHHLVHEGGWEIEGDPTGTLRFTGPGGRVLTTGPPGLRTDVRHRLRGLLPEPPPQPAFA
jgi:hypothetical protein